MATDPHASDHQHRASPETDGAANEAQRTVCARFGAEWVRCAPGQKVAVARGFRVDVIPLNGVRMPPEGTLNGWFVWSGEHAPQEDDAYQSECLGCFAEAYPDLLPYLGLAPGWRFLLAPGYEDVWFQGLPAE